MDRERIYEEEKIRFEARQRIKNKRRSIGCLVMILVSIALYYVAYYSDKSNEIPVGSEVLLYSNTTTVPVFSDQDALLECQQTADSTKTVKRIVAQNRVTMVANGTRARIDRSSSNSYRVEILEGEYAGRRGYVETTAIRYKESK